MQNLNPEQLAVVKHFQGPLLVIAGAGTGKTKTVTQRILHLLKEQQVPVSSILALTFTEAATREMQERVETELPISYEEICIKTFHGFCDQILRERGHEIGLPTSFKLMDKLAQWLFFKKNLFQFRLNYYRPLGNPNKFISDLLGFFGRLKDENIGPEKYLIYAEGLEDEEEKQKHLELAQVFSDYQNLLLQNSLMDFADLNYYVLKLLNSRQSVLKEYQERYQHIMVDEFQDTNLAQSELIFLLSGAHQNIVVVGDDDQSIYKWRGASLSNIIHFRQKFPNAQTLVLKENYRSRQNILDTAYHLIQNNNPDRLEVREGIDKKLLGQSGGGEKVKIVRCRTLQEEISFTVAEMQKKMQLGTELGWNDFAVLLRNNALSEPYVQAFKKAGIPYQIKNLKSVLKTEMGRDIYALFRIMRSFDDDIAMYRILTMPCFGLDVTIVQNFVSEAHKNSTSLYDYLKAKFTQSSIDLADNQVIEILSKLEQLKETSYKKLIGEIIYDFLEAFQVMQFLQEDESEENIQNIEDLASLSRIVQQFDHENIYPNPKDFLDYLETLDETNMQLESEMSAHDNAVQILTVHGSKGLEFKHVFVGSLVNERFPSRKHSEPLEVPLELTNEILPEKDFRLEEERRLMYVAITRAKEELYLTYSDKYDGPKNWKPSKFVEEIRGIASVETVEYPEVKLIPYQAEAPAQSERPDFVIKKLSFSQLDVFQTCPLKYKFRYVYQLATPPSHASEFGSSIHNTLNAFYQVLRSGQEVSLDLLKNLYDEHWRAAGYSSKAHQLTRKKKGWEMLENFYSSNSHPSWVIPAFLERPFSLKFEDKIINGRIDRIDKLPDGTYEIIDYKTGQSKKDSKLNIDLQLGIYALAGREVYKIPVSKLSLHFLDDNVKQSIETSELKMDKIEEKISAYCAEMVESNFPAKPSAFSCGFCDYSLICKASAIR